MPNPESDLFKLCSRCHEDYLHCTCENFHPNVDPGLEWDKNLFNLIDTEREKTFPFTFSELKALYTLLEHEYINPNNTEVHAVLNKIADIIKCHHGSTK